MSTATRFLSTVGRGSSRRGARGGAGQRVFACGWRTLMLPGLFFSGCFNGDPHPGNILLLKDGRLGLIDYGQVKRIDAHQRCGTAVELQASPYLPPHLLTVRFLVLSLTLSAPSPFPPLLQTQTSFCRDARGLGRRGRGPHRRCAPPHGLSHSQVQQDRVAQACHARL